MKTYWHDMTYILVKCVYYVLMFNNKYTQTCEQQIFKLSINAMKQVIK